MTNHGRDDAALVERARCGDLDAFGALVRRHEDMVYRVALRMLGDPQDAQDVAQDAFVRAWRSLAGFEGRSALATWLYRIVTNLSRNHLRARRRTEPLPEDVTDDRPGPYQQVSHSDDLDRALEALQRLAPGDRAAFVLRELEGRPYRDIAEILDVSEAAVRSRLRRARRDVINALQEVEREEHG